MEVATTERHWNDTSVPERPELEVLLRSGHDMIHRSMLIMYDQQSFMAMINDHSV